MKQTAVQWLWEQVDNLIPYQDETKARIFNNLKNQAMEMEKEQIIDAYDDADKNSFGKSYGHGKIYYNETYIQEDTEDTWDGRWESGELDPSGCSGPYANI